MSKVKEKLQAKPETETEKPKETLPAVHYDDPWAEAAAETGGNLGRLLKFVKGKFLIAEEEVPLGTEYVAHVNQIARGWVKFLEGKPVDRVVGMLRDGFKMPKRADLPDYDNKARAKWEKDSKGTPRDPWAEQWFLPLISVETGELVTFVGGSDGADQAMGRLCDQYSRRRHTGQLPIVALAAGGYNHKIHKTWVDTPVFKVVSWDGAPSSHGGNLPAQPTLADDAGVHPAGSSADEMDDATPF